MNIVYIVAEADDTAKQTMSCIQNGIERQGRAVLVCAKDSTTDSILAMCSSPVPFAIMLIEFDQELVNLERLHAEPRLKHVTCYVRASQMVDDGLDDILPVTAGIVAKAMAV